MSLPFGEKKSLSKTVIQITSWSKSLTVNIICNRGPIANYLGDSEEGWLNIYRDEAAEGGERQIEIGPDISSI